MNNLYHHPGLTDLQSQIKQAEKAAIKGETSWVHQHPRSEECNEECRIFGPAQKEN